MKTEATTSIPLARQEPLTEAADIPAQRVRRPQYGRYLEDMSPGTVCAHPRGFTFDRDGMTTFARVFMQANPLYLNVEHARAHGFPDLPASPQQVFNVVLSLGVQNDSEKAIANLGYYDVQFLRPVYPGDTLRAFTQVAACDDKGADRPGIALIRTLGTNQRGEVVLQYQRKIMVPHRGDRPETLAAATADAPFPWVEAPSVSLPMTADAFPSDLTGRGTYFEDFAVGDVIVHPNGRTITDEHMAWTYLVGNTHPLHFDRVYSTGLSGAMSGEPIVYGGLVFAWLDGLASRDATDNALWELGFTEGYHTQPAISGDTVFSLSRVLACEPAPPPLDERAGLVTFQLIGVKNISAAQALDAHGDELFLRENDKKKRGLEKLPAKIFEIERRLLIKRRSS